MEGNMQEGIFTCREVYEEGAALLEELEDGRLDARLLLEYYCGIPAHRLLADPETAVKAEEREAFLAGIHRRAAREPLAYITGEQSFMGLPFVVSPDVLIPEQDTENMVEEALRYLEDGSRILDLCTGSGCILLSLLHYSNSTTGVGTDLSERALYVARENAQKLGLSERSEWRTGDLFEALGPGERFDIIVFPYEYQADTYFIKRIIGLPGETVYIDEEGNIYINGELLEEKIYRSDSTVLVC